MNGVERPATGAEITCGCIAIVAFLATAVALILGLAAVAVVAIRVIFG